MWLLKLYVRGKVSLNGMKTLCEHLIHFIHHWTPKHLLCEHGVDLQQFCQRVYNCCNSVMERIHNIKYCIRHTPPSCVAFFHASFSPRLFLSDTSSLQSLSEGCGWASLFLVSRKQSGQEVLNQPGAQLACLLHVGLISLSILAYIYSTVNINFYSSLARDLIFTTGW